MQKSHHHHLHPPPTFNTSEAEHKTTLWAHTLLPSLAWPTTTGVSYPPGETGVNDTSGSTWKKKHLQPVVSIKVQLSMYPLWKDCSSEHFFFNSYRFSPILDQIMYIIFEGFFFRAQLVASSPSWSSTSAKLTFCNAVAQVWTILSLTSMRLSARCALPRFLCASKKGRKFRVWFSNMGSLHPLEN